MIEKKHDLAEVAKFYYKVWNKRVSWEDKEMYYKSGRTYSANVNLDKDVTFIINLVELLNTLTHLTKEEKEQIVKGGRKWLINNSVSLCSILHYTEQEIKDLTALDVQGMVSEILGSGKNNSTVQADILKKLYKEKQTETVEAIKVYIQNQMLGLSLLDLQRGKYSPARLAKQMVGKAFCSEMDIGWVKEGGNWKTLEQEMAEVK